MKLDEFSTQIPFFSCPLHSRIMMVLKVHKPSVVSMLYFFTSPFSLEWLPVLQNSGPRLFGMITLNNRGNQILVSKNPLLFDLARPLKFSDSYDSKFRDCHISRAMWKSITLTFSTSVYFMKCWLINIRYWSLKLIAVTQFCWLKMAYI